MTVFDPSGTWIDWKLHGHQFVTHLTPGRSHSIHNPVDGFLLDPAGNALEFKALADGSQVFAA